MALQAPDQTIWGIPLGVLALVVSILSLILSIVVAIWTKQRTDAAVKQYELKLKQYLDATSLVPKVSLRQSRFSLRLPNLPLEVANICKVPILDVNIAVGSQDASYCIYDRTISFLESDDTEFFDIGPKVREYLEKRGIVTITEAGPVSKIEEPLNLKVECSWTPGITQGKKNRLIKTLLLTRAVDLSSPIARELIVRLEEGA